jgi:hypothetical protein
MKYKILQHFMHKSIKLSMALKVGRRKAAAMLILFTVRLSNEKSAKAPRSPPSNGLDSAQPISKQNQL